VQVLLSKETSPAPEQGVDTPEPVQVEPAGQLPGALWPAAHSSPAEQAVMSPLEQ
jgi:hypothetical protein